MQLKESVCIDSATACLYFGAVSKNILDPVLHDRNGQFNTVSTNRLTLKYCMCMCLCVINTHQYFSTRMYIFAYVSVRARLPIYWSICLFDLEMKVRVLDVVPHVHCIISLIPIHPVLFLLTYPIISYNIIHDTICTVHSTLYVL